MERISSDDAALSETSSSSKQSYPQPFGRSQYICADNRISDGQENGFPADSRQNNAVMGFPSLRVQITFQRRDTQTSALVQPLKKPAARALAIPSKTSFLTGHRSGPCEFRPNGGSLPPAIPG
jgi:hypothetical protein